MTNNEKQIEEMSKELEKDINTPMYSYHYLASKLQPKSWVKLPKDSVVISKKEYERLKRVENEKDRLYEIKLDLENQLIEKGWTDYEGADEIEKRVSKEMAEKWYNEVKKLYLENVGEQVFEHNWFGVRINKFAKQCGIKIKE